MFIEQPRGERPYAERSGATDARSVAKRSVVPAAKLLASLRASIKGMNRIEVVEVKLKFSLVLPTTSIQSKNKINSNKNLDYLNPNP